MLATFRDILAINDDDGVECDVDALRVDCIREEVEYGGLRLRTTASFKRLRREARPQGKAFPSGGKILSPFRKRACVDHVRSQLAVSERRACRVIALSHATQRWRPKILDDEATIVRPAMKWPV